jgi:hypothetical protein
MLLASCLDLAPANADKLARIGSNISDSQARRQNQMRTLDCFTPTQTTASHPMPRTQYKPGTVHPPHQSQDAIDIHCHAHANKIPTIWRGGHRSDRRPVVQKYSWR